jgi:hypothetical protein
MADRDNLYPACAGASLRWHEKCPRCGAGRQDNCGDNAAYEAQLRRRGVTPPCNPCCATKDTEIAAIRAERDRLAEDADRFRWLLKHWNNDAIEVFITPMLTDDGDEIRADIDTMRRAVAGE